MTKPSEAMNALEKRGIAEIAAKLGWEAKRDGYWHYPVWDAEGKVIATRAKAMPDTKGAKYLWPDGKPENPAADWYTPPGTKEAIEAAGGVCYLANGEASLLAFHAAGIHNVIATCHGENTVPKSTDVTLKQFRIATLINIADKDKAGLNAAVKWRDSLLLSDTEYIAKQWPEYLPEKSDMNDLWIALGFDATKAQQAVNDCEALILPQPETKPIPKALLSLDFSEGRARLVSALYEEMNRANLLERKIFKTIWHQCHCPFHDDKNASAGFNIESGVLNCMGECGKSFSPKELSEKLGIDWRSYFQAEGKKKPKKADLSRFQEVIEAMPALSYEDSLLEEMKLRLFIHEQRQFVGFGQWKHLPLSALSAVMTLSSGRSNIALFLGRLHDALIRGELPTVFNREMAVKATRMPYNMVSKGLFEAEHLSFISKLRSIIFSIDSIPPKETMKNSEGRPCDWYMVELDASEILPRLKEMLEIYFLEKHARKALAMPTLQMAGQLHADSPILAQWREKVQNAMNDRANKSAKNAFDTEMHGNGKNWHGWERALQSKAIAPLDYFACEDSLDLRAKLLQWWVSKHRAENSREELCRLLGCTDPVIDKVMAKANFASDKQHCKVEFPAPKTVKQWAMQWSKFQRDKQGKCWKGGFWDVVDKAWIPFDDKDYLETFAKLSGRITKGYMLIQSPSKQRPMTEDEIQERAEKQTKEQAIAIVPATPLATPDKPVATQDTPKRNYEYAKWDKHSYPFLYRQAQLFVHCFTAHKLEALAILDKQGKALVTGELGVLMQWALENASDKPKRRVSSFYGKNFDEEKDMVALQALADERKARYDIHEELEIEDNAEMPVQKSLDFVPVVVFRKPTPSPAEDNWTWAEHELEFAERMLAIGGRP